MQTYVLIGFPPFRPGFSIRAEYELSRNGSRALMVDGHKYVKDRETTETINWRCSNFIRFKCRSRAITRTVQGVDRVRVTNGTHSHQPMFVKKPCIVLFG